MTAPRCAPAEPDPVLRAFVRELARLAARRDHAAADTASAARGAPLQAPRRA